ncbi:MAG: hypothetical protein ISS23_01305 [Nanoarchaeota archaeon]|nr:hypothetical protein [Nanoarchaeota archaeon]
MKPTLYPTFSTETEGGIEKMEPGIHGLGSLPPDTESKNVRGVEFLDVESPEEISIGANITIMDKELQNYKEVLSEKLGYSTALDKLTIDSRGDSPELKEELGEGYLDSRVIIVSEEQLENLSLLPDNPSHMGGVISKISKDLVKKITPYEALIGNVNILYGSNSVTGFFDSDFEDQTAQSEEGLYVALTLDTLTEAVRKMDFLNNKIGFIKENTLKQLDKNLIESILTDIHPLTTKYGSIEPIRDLSTSVIDAPIKDDIIYFKHKSYDSFLFNGSEPFLIYYGKKKTKSKLPLEVLHSSDESGIMNLLVKNEFLRIEKENLSDRLEIIAKSVLENHALDNSESTGFKFYKTFKKFKDNPEVVKKLKEGNWYTLRDICYGKIKFNSLPLETKKMITKPKNELVEKYLRLFEEKTSISLIK